MNLRDLKLEIRPTFSTEAIQPAQQAQALSFSRISLKAKPAWSNSAAWSPDGASLIIADTRNKILMKFSLAGDLIQTITAIGGGLDLIQGTESGYLIEARDGGFIWVDQNFSQLKTLDVKAETADKQMKVTSVFGWTFVNDDLLTFGDLEKNAGTSVTTTPNENMGVQSRLLKVSQHSPIETEPLRQLGSVARRFFLTGYPLLASVDNKAYALLLEDNPRILEIGFSMKELQSFPRDYRKVPSLPIKPSSAVEVFRPIEQSTMAIALIGWHRMLYLLTRKPLREGHSQWTIWPIDPCKDRLSKGTVLPTQAAHITIVPGHKKWAIIEKGPVTRSGSQEISSVLFLDSNTIEATHRSTDKESTAVTAP